MKQDLELIVDEPIPGHFYWTIVRMGQPGELHSIVNYARGPMPTRSSSMDAGSAMLLHYQKAGSPWFAPSPAMRHGWADTVPATLLHR
ncbi:MAG: hypothetical protein EOP82_26410 [Variovorax sp.]|nr:MAG: hypothetical protein EOP82_26410 [Variovorax sp.]